MSIQMIHFIYIELKVTIREIVQIVEISISLVIDFVYHSTINSLS